MAIAGNIEQRELALAGYPEVTETRLWTILRPHVREGVLTVWEAIAIFRCLQYSDQIADVSLGNMFRPDVAGLLAVAE